MSTPSLTQFPTSLPSKSTQKIKIRKKKKKKKRFLFTTSNTNLFQSPKFSQAFFMSDIRESSIEETNVDAEGEDDDDDDADDQIQQQPPKKKKRKKKKKKEGGNRVGFERKLRGAKNLIMSPILRLEKACTRKSTRPPPAPFPYSEDSGKSCHFCFMQPSVLPDSPPLAQNPGAKSSNYHEFLKSLIESNDFYSPECNVHRDDSV